MSLDYQNFETIKTTKKLLKINNGKKIHFSLDDMVSWGEQKVMLTCRTASGYEPVDSFTETPMTVDEFRQAIDENKICKTCLRELLRWKHHMEFVEMYIDMMYGDD